MLFGAIRPMEQPIPTTHSPEKISNARRMLARNPLGAIEGSNRGAGLAFQYFIDQDRFSPQKFQLCCRTFLQPQGRRAQGSDFTAGPLGQSRQGHGWYSLYHGWIVPSKCINARILNFL